MNKPLDNRMLETAEAEARWRDEYAAQIGEDRTIRNRSGIEVKPLYTPADWDGENYLESLG